ncbi:zinc finger, CCHC-type containing protein [Tanacetum coccineum]
MDVKTTFLNGDLDEEVYMKQPKGFVMPGNEHKFDSSSKGVIICLYVDDMLIFGTDQNQVDETKKLLSSRFSMKDMGEADVILGIKIKRENKGIVITQSHYIEKILKKFNREDCSPVNTPMDPVEKLKPNTGNLLSRFTSNPSRQQSNNKASKKQTCIISSTMKSEFVALAAASKEAEWLRNLVYEIPVWPKPIAPISIRCDSAPTMTNAYSQIYNGKSRHLGVRHSMVRKLIRNGVISIEFVRIQHNLVDHLTKGLARDLVNNITNESLDDMSIVSMGIDLIKAIALEMLRAVVRLLDPKRKNLGKKGIDCIFVGYAEHSKSYRFSVIEPNDSVSINIIIESRDAIFDENHFSLIPRLKDIIPNAQESQMDDHTDDVPSEILEPRKEAIDDEIGATMENNTWVLSDLPPGCKHLGCKWIFKRKMKVDGTIDKFKARLVIQGFRQKEVIHQLDVKTTFLNDDLDEKVYMKQPKGFVKPGNEHKFDSSSKGIIICLYVDDMLIFGTDQNQVDETKKLLSSRFSMKDIGEADVILGIKIKRENKGIVITQSYYIEKILKKFNHEDYSPMNTLMDPVEKLKRNTGKPVDQLEYSRAIGCLMYAMTSTRPDIAYALGRLSTKDYGLSYVGYPSVLEGYSDASWINHVEDSSSTSGWVFLLGGGAISWASKKQTCITSSTMESEFVAMAAAAEWLRNLIYVILICPKPIAPIYIRCDSALTMAKAYSQIYNGKSRHLGVRHSMVRELIKNGVISIEFVRIQHNLADHLKKDLARDLVNNEICGTNHAFMRAPGKIGRLLSPLWLSRTTLGASHPRSKLLQRVARASLRDETPAQGPQFSLGGRTKDLWKSGLARPHGQRNSVLREEFRGLIVARTSFSF